MPVIEGLMTMSAGFNYDGLPFVSNDPNALPDFKKLAHSGTTKHSEHGE